jgi:hypothetical protein
VVTCILGLFTQYGTILNELLTRYNYSEKETSLINASANFIALFCVYLISISIDKYKKYKLSFVMLSIFGILTFSFFSIHLEYIEKNTILMLIIWSLTSSALLPIYTCSMDFVCEITYPVGETISGGILIISSQISGIIAVKMI